MNEYELIYLAQEEKEGEARDRLYKNYEALINLKTKDYITLNGNQGLDISDIKLELKYVFEKAVDSYNPDSSASFKTFLITLINNFLKNYKRDNERLKNKYLNESVSIYDVNGIDYSNVLYRDEDLIENVIFDNNLDANDIYNNFNSKEKELIELIRKGYTFKEVASILDKDIKYVYNVVYHIRNKINKNMLT